jgi:hypothetical protein
MILHVTDAKYLGNFRVQVSFNDGREGVAELRDALRGPVFEPLRDESLFAQLSVDTELDTISWPTERISRRSTSTSTHSRTSQNCKRYSRTGGISHNQAFHPTPEKLVVLRSRVGGGAGEGYRYVLSRTLQYPGRRAW